MEIRRWYALIELLSSSIWNESAVRQSQAEVVINQFTALAKDPSKIAVATSWRPEAAPEGGGNLLSGYRCSSIGSCSFLSNSSLPISENRR
jgi:hypothetical protein